MKVAVVQHALRESAMEDMAALVESVQSAHRHGADLVVLPEVASVHDDAEARQHLTEAFEKLPCVRLMPYAGQDVAGASFGIEDPAKNGSLGIVSVLVGDAVLDPENWEGIVTVDADLLVICPRSESELQAEAVLELGLKFSDSVAGLVLIAECDGAEVGDAGHGGSAIIALGEVVAEAMSGDDVLVADVALPIARPEPREPLPELPTLLAQRIANHRGAKVAVDYPADLSDGRGPR